MDYFLFARISDYYVLLDDAMTPREVNPSNSRFFPAKLIDALPTDEHGFCSRDELARMLEQNLRFTSPHYRCVTGDRFVLLIAQQSRRRRLGWARKKQHEAIAVEALQRVTEFRLETKKRLIESLFSRQTNLADYVRAWSEYLFCDHYSLWIYNHYTEVFIVSTSSFPYKKTHIFRSESSSLNAVLEADYATECRPPRQDRSNYQETQDMRTLNRIKLRLGLDGTMGVLSFYSRFPDFVLKRRNHQEIQHSIETKYLQARQQARQSMTEINQHFIESYRTGELKQFLHRIVREICDKFQCEACSIFLHEPGSSILSLAATCDLDHTGEPSRAVTYDLARNTFTTKAFRSRQLSFSYDLTGERGDGEHVEHTANELANEIAVPLHYGDSGLGVLLVKNKYGLDDNGIRAAIDFRNSDFSNLIALGANLSNLIRIESLFNEEQRNLLETNTKMNEMEDFNKVFLHEIRTPISKFTMAPELIKRALSKPELTEEDLHKVMRQLDDIRVMGDRLEFVAKTYNFNQIVTRRDFQVLSVLRDIVFPVVNITRSYLRKQYEIDIELDSTGLKSCRVYGDKTLLNIVFNTLIDNAGKYSIETRRPITVSGGYEDGGKYFIIDVSNYGLPIHPDEAQAIFQKGVRGLEAIRRGIGGTGIGLYLAQRIMSEGDGELLLTSMQDPVTFAMRIPAREKGSAT